MSESKNLQERIAGFNEFVLVNLHDEIENGFIPHLNKPHYINLSWVKDVQEVSESSEWLPDLKGLIINSVYDGGVTNHENFSLFKNILNGFNLSFKYKPSQTETNLVNGVNVINKYIQNGFLQEDLPSVLKSTNDSLLELVPNKNKDDIITSNDIYKQRLDIVFNNLLNFGTENVDLYLSDGSRFIADYGEQEDSEKINHNLIYNLEKLETELYVLADKMNDSILNDTKALMDSKLFLVSSLVYNKLSKEDGADLNNLNDLEEDMISCYRNVFRYTLNNPNLNLVKGILQVLNYNVNGAVPLWTNQVVSEELEKNKKTNPERYSDVQKSS